MVSYAIMRVPVAADMRWTSRTREIEVDITIGTELVQITIEAPKDAAPSDKRRFATMAIPREQFAAALGVDLRDRGGPLRLAPLRLVPNDD